MLVMCHLFFYGDSDDDDDDDVDKDGDDVRELE